MSQQTNPELCLDEAVKGLVPHIFGQTNDESWVITLNQIPGVHEDRGVSAPELLDTLQTLGAYADVPTPSYKYMWVKLRDANLAHVLERTDDDGFKRTAMGELAAAAGGHMLALTAQCSIPSRHLVGETPSLSGQRDTVTARLAILHYMLGHAPQANASTSSIVGYMREYGFSDESISSQLSRLSAFGILEKSTKMSAPSGQKIRYKLKDTQNGSMPRTAAERYIELVRGIVRMDDQLLVDGLEEAQTRLNNPKLVGMYFLRAALNNPRSTLRTSNVR